MSKQFRRATSRRNINLLLYQWIALDKIAQQTKSFCLRGTRKGNRSWRCLLRRIAEGELIVIPRAGANGIADNHAAGQATPASKPTELYGPPQKRKRGRPISFDQKPIEAPADWIISDLTQGTQNAEKAA